MFVGAGSFQSKLDVSVEIVDARSGAPIVALSKVDAATEGTQTPINLGPGVFSGDPIERMFAQLAGHLRDWLLKA